MDKTSLGDRMKNNYENIHRNYLTRRMPLIIRLDGVAFHTLTKKLNKPYDKNFKDCMMGTAKFLVENIMGAKLAYVQSDEISILITDYDELTTEAWFGKNLQKIVSVSASMATLIFNQLYNDLIPKEKRIKEYGLFDSRAFVIPKEEVVNYFIFRMNDATRNSIQGLGQSLFSHKQLQGKSCDAIQDMLMLEKEINWNDTPVYFKRGGCVYRDRSEETEIPTLEGVVKSCKDRKKCEKKFNGLVKTLQVEEDSFIDTMKCRDCIRKNAGGIKPSNKIVTDLDIPIFTQDRNFIEQFVNLDVRYATNRKVRIKASEILQGMDDDVRRDLSLRNFVGGADNIVDELTKEYNMLKSGNFKTKELTEFDDQTEESIFEHSKLRGGFTESEKTQMELTLPSYKGDVFNVMPESIVVCHLMTKKKVTAPLRVRYSNEYLCWMFGNHTMQMLKELDSDIRFSLIKI